MVKQKLFGKTLGKSDMIVFFHLILLLSKKLMCLWPSRLAYLNKLPFPCHQLSIVCQCSTIEAWCKRKLKNQENPFLLSNLKKSCIQRKKVQLKVSAFSFVWRNLINWKYQNSKKFYFYNGLSYQIQAFSLMKSFQT